MMKVTKSLIPVVGLLLLLSACDERTEKTDGSGVILSISDFDGVPVQVSVNDTRAEGGLLQLDSITVQSILKSLDARTSDLQNIEMSSYEVRFSRGDGGVNLPPPLVNRVFGVTPAGGDNTYENLPILTMDQLEARPLVDYFLENGGFDRETGRSSTTLNFHIQFFGRSIEGEAVTSNVASFSVKFVQ